jgi:hypothetical protein
MERPIAMNSALRWEVHVLTLGVRMIIHVAKKTPRDVMIVLMTRSVGVLLLLE